MRYVLNERLPGFCPVCGHCWSADPDLECPCTRARPDDDAEMERAYAKSAAHRSAWLRADMQDASRRIRAAVQRHQSGQGHADVVPITRPLAHRRPYSRHAR